MSILNKNEIIKLAEDKDKKILGDHFKKENVQGSSYDLRIGTIYDNKRIISSTRNEDEIVDLLPSEIITILTLEEVNLPNDICGTVFAMNSKSSKGLLILNPGHIDPGFKGPLSICAVNLSEETQFLSRGEEIFTIIFQKLSSQTDPYPNNFLGTREDFETKFYKEKSAKLSPSFFDLLKVNKYESHLTKLISSVLWKKFWYVFFPLVVGLATIIGLFGPSIGTKNLKEKINAQEILIHQKESIINNYKDSVINDLNNKLNKTNLIKPDGSK